MKSNNFWKEIEKDLFIIYSEDLEDFRAVLGAKTSRTAHLELKSDLSPELIKEFADKNIFNYGHASIAEMSFPSIFSRNFGWISSWFLADNPLFVGQEVSTRAVNPLIKSLPCFDSREEDRDSFNLFSMIFSELISKLEEKGGYRYDSIRWSIPGNFRTGTTVMMNSRVLLRHLMMLENIIEMKEVVRRYLLGAQICSPAIFRSIYKEGKYFENNLPARWKSLSFIREEKEFRIEPINNGLNLELLSQIERRVGSRKNSRSYLDDEYANLGLFKVHIECSIAAARDFHRHRAMMPWILNLLIDREGLPFISRHYNVEDSYTSAVKNTFLKFSEKHANKNSINFFDLYSLPLGTMVSLVGFGTLPKLLYMLELRSKALGANFEYRKIAETGLKELYHLLGERFCRENNIVLPPI